MATAPSSNPYGSPSHSPEHVQGEFDVFPPLTRSTTLPATLPSPGTHASAGPSLSAGINRQDRSRLAPEDAILASPPRLPQRDGLPPFDTLSGGGGGGSGGQSQRTGRSLTRHHHRHGSSRAGKRSSWKKLLWVKQSFPDNYTDQATFLENLQRNPRLQPYDFWPLFADSTVILQHVCSVIIFVVCFVGIFQERVSPVAVVSWSSLLTFVGWLFWERWQSQETDATAENAIKGDMGTAANGARPGAAAARLGASRSSSVVPRNRSLPPRPPLSLQPPASTTRVTSAGFSPGIPSATSSTTNLSAANLSATNLARQLSGSASASATSLHSNTDTSATSQAHHRARSSLDIARSSQDIASPPPSTLSPPPNLPVVRRNRGYSYSVPTRIEPTGGRGHERLGTIKSALLIYSTLLGLSPILKSLTRSTSSDSIWAMSFWLLAVNIFSFDYSTTGASTKVPASLSTNAALMASTVLASRLPSTGHVFSLTLFSIEVFGLFPVFRRHARHRSWSYHYVMSALLVLGAGGGVGIIVGDHTVDGPLFPWKNALAGMMVAVLMSAVAMGGCSWWLIGLQKYKNEIYGPWDPARPIIMSRRQWD